MVERNQVGIGLSYRPASLCSLATQFQTRFLESIPCPISGLKFSTLYNASPSTGVTIPFARCPSILSMLEPQSTQTGNGHFLAYIPSWFKNQPSLGRVGGTPSPFHSIYHHEQSRSVRSAERADTLPLFLIHPYMYSVAGTPPPPSVPTNNYRLCVATEENNFAWTTLRMRDSVAKERILQIWGIFFVLGVSG
jgi:hypothetical protein